MLQTLQEAVRKAQAACRPAYRSGHGGDVLPDDSDDSDEKIKKWFEQLGPDDMGKYKM